MPTFTTTIPCIDYPLSPSSPHLCCYGSSWSTPLQSLGIVHGLDSLGLSLVLVLRDLWDTKSFWVFIGPPTIPQGDSNKYPKVTLALIGNELYRAYIQCTWVIPQSPLTPKLLHYSHHFLRIDRGLIRPPSYVSLHLPIVLWMFLGQFRVCSHQLRIESDHHLACELQVCWLCLLEPETEDYFIFQCSVYYEIQGQYHYLFRDAHSSISTFFQFLDHRCLTLYFRETFLHKKHLLSDSQHPIGD